MKISLLQKIGLATGLFLVPSLVFAQDIYDFIDEFMDLMNALIPVIIGLAVVFFLWGLLTYILKTENQEARKEARNRMFWGIVIIFVMVSIWGFVNLLDNTLGLDNDTPNLPMLDGGGCDGFRLSTGDFSIGVQNCD